jgi:hypothetical protein
VLIERTHPEARRAPPTCPACASAAVVPILYGSPAEAALEDERAGKLALGGCVLTDDDPEWRCTSCGRDFGRARRDEFDDGPTPMHATADRSFAVDLLSLVEERLFDERLAHTLSKAAVERQLAFDLAKLIEEMDPSVAAIPECGGTSGVGNIDLLVVPADSAKRGKVLQAPRPLPHGTRAIELKQIRSADGTRGSYGYDGVLADLRAELHDKPAKLPAETHGVAAWLGITLMTDGAWRSSPDQRSADEVAHEVRIHRWRPCPEGLLCIGSVLGALTYREWHGSVWVEAFVPTSGDPPGPARANIHVPPPDSTSGNSERSLWWYAIHGADGGDLDGYGHGPAHLRVTTEALHGYRRAQYAQLGTWGGSFEELRLCLFMEQRIWRGSDTEPHFERWPGVASLLGELRAAWEAENAGN